MDENPVDQLVIMRQAVEQLSATMPDIMPLVRAAREAARDEGFSDSEQMQIAIEAFRLGCGK